MNHRTAADLSLNLFHTYAREKKDTVNIDISAGIGGLRWDDDHNGESRIHADASFGINSVYFSFGTFVTCGNEGGPALGIRTTGGYFFPNRLYIGGYWEFAAKLPGTSRASRGGIGIQAGFNF
jgi:hypothetical protein